MATWPIRAAGTIFRTSTPELAPVGLEFERLSRSVLTFLPEREIYTVGDLIHVTAAPNADGDLQLETLLVGAPGQVLGIADDLPAWRTPVTYLAHGLFSDTHVDTVPGAPVAGDVIIADAAGPTWSALPIGGAGAVLVVNPGGVQPQWVAPAPLAGQILHFDGLSGETLFTIGLTYDESTGVLKNVGPTRAVGRLLAGFDADPNSLLESSGSFAAEIDTLTGNTTLTDQHYTVLCDASGGGFTVTLPPAAGVARRIYHIKKIDATANAVTVDGDGSETIDGALTQVITTQFNSIPVHSNGVFWSIL